jgi:16S rRNA (guanine527-N7)-methyltransferase
MYKDTIIDTAIRFAGNHPITGVEKIELIVDSYLARVDDFNVSTIRLPDDVLEKHVADSLALLLVPEIFAAKDILDVGSGAGFPGLVLAAVLPARVCCLESVGKKCRFIEQTAQEVMLENVIVQQGRAEETAHASGREMYDFVTARAVADMAVLVELCMGFVSVGGLFVAMKGPDCRDEVEAASAAIRMMGGGAVEVIEYSLPASGAGRSLVAVKKIAPTPLMLPRRSGVPAKKPLK